MSVPVYVCSFLACWLSAMPADSQPYRFEFTEVHMGVPFKLIFYAADQNSAKVASRAAFDRIATLNRSMSDYDAHSELMRLCRTAGKGRAVPVSPELFDVLSRSQRLAQETDGAFDVTVGPMVRLWRRARRRKQLPSPERLAEAIDLVGYKNLLLDPEAQTVELLKPGMRLDLGGIAKGYAADAALATLREHGIPRALVDGSGDIALGDPPPGKKGWRIAIAPLDVEARRNTPHPTPHSPHTLLLHNTAVATSGDRWQYVEIDGTRYSHLVDPHTGLGLTDHSSVTLIAPNCTTADSLASAVSVLGPKRGLELVEKTPGVAAYIERKPEGRIETYQSSRMKGYMASGETIPRDAD